MNAFPEKNQKTFVEHNGHRITKAWMRQGTKEVTVYRAWKRNKDVWTPLPGVFQSADDARNAIEETNNV